MTLTSPQPLDELELQFRPFEQHLRSCRTNLIHTAARAPGGVAVAGLFRRGKLLRPLLTLASAEVAGGSAADVMPAAEAVELLHVASLVHDDIIDDAETRRSVPALQVSLGTPAALVAGDYLLLAAFSRLAAAGESFPADRVVRATHELATQAEVCCRGQADELAAARDASLMTYLDIVRAKTSPPFVAAVVLGACLSGARDGVLEALRHYAVELGIAFQIRDDVLDLVGDAETMGKPGGNSLAHGRPLLPLILLRQADPGAQRRGVAPAAPGGDRLALVEELRARGILDTVEGIARDRAALAAAALDELPPHPAVALLRALSIYAVSRAR